MTVQATEEKILRKLNWRKDISDWVKNKKEGIAGFISTLRGVQIHQCTNQFRRLFAKEKAPSSLRTR
jgi:hypothetical protein